MHYAVTTDSQQSVSLSVLMSILFVAVLSSTLAEAYPNARSSSLQSTLSNASSSERVAVVEGVEEQAVSGFEGVARVEPTAEPQRLQPSEPEKAGKEEKLGTINLCTTISRILESTSCGNLHQPCLSLQAQAQVLEKCQRWRAYSLPPGSHHSDPYDGESDDYDLNALNGPELEELRTIRASMERELETRRGWGLRWLLGAAAAGMALGWVISLIGFQARARGIMMMSREKPTGNVRWRAMERNGSSLLLPVIRE